MRTSYELVSTIVPYVNHLTNECGANDVRCVRIWNFALTATLALGGTAHNSEGRLYDVSADVNELPTDTRRKFPPHHTTRG